MDNWDDLRLALAIHRAGSVSGAAKQLNLNHATVSRRLASAEERIGTRLFERIGTGMRPTAAGKKLIESASRLEKDIDALDITIAANDKRLEGPLRITAPQLIIEAMLAEIIRDFSEVYPRVEMSLNASNDIVNLHRREADVAIRISNEPAPSLFGPVATSQKAGFFASRDYLAKLDTHSPTPEAHTPGYVAFHWWGTDVPKPLAEIHPTARVALVVDDMIAAVAAVRNGIGIGRMPCFVANMHDDLVPVPGCPFEPYLDIWVLTHPELKRVERVRKFMQFAAERIRARKNYFVSWEGERSKIVSGFDHDQFENEL